MSEVIMVLAFAFLILWMIAEDRRQQADPLRPQLDTLMGRVSASCDYSNHDECAYPGRLLFGSTSRCECPCHRGTA